jgi:glycosyltransferase involved in cell wall biosynthesis
VVNRTILIPANSDLRYDRRLQRIAGSLRKAGYKVQLLGRHFFGPPPEKSGDVSFIRLWFGKGKLAYLELNIRMFFWLLFRKADAICSVDLDTLPACAIAAGFNGCKLIQDSHEYMAEVPEVAGRPATKAIWHLVARWFLPACDLRYTASQSMAAEFQEKYKVQFEVIRNMPLLQEESETSPLPPEVPERDYLVYLGAVNQGRGLEEILDALVGRDEVLLIIGDGDKSSVIHSLVKLYELENRVFFAGRRRPEELPLLLRNARAGINLLRDEGLSYRFSLANKFFDYVHAGIPQVCIDFPEYRSLMDEYRVGVACSIGKDDVHRALDALKNSKGHSDMKAEAVKARQVWNWQEEEKHLIRLYERLFQK